MKWSSRWALILDLRPRNLLSTRFRSGFVLLTRTKGIMSHCWCRAGLTTLIAGVSVLSILVQRLPRLVHRSRRRSRARLLKASIELVCSIPRKSKSSTRTTTRTRTIGKMGKTPTLGALGENTTHRGTTSLDKLYVQRSEVRSSTFGVRRE